MSRNKNDIERSLKKKGFRTRDNDHKYFIYYTTFEKKTIIITKISHGESNQQLSDDLVSMMSKQCKLSKTDFLSLIDCSMSQDGYETKLEALGLIR